MSVGIIPYFSFNELVVEPLGLTYGRWIKGRRNVASNQIIWSDTGIDGWTASTSPLNNIYSMDFSPEQGLIMALQLETNTYMTSTNSVIWTSRSFLSNMKCRGIKWCPSFGKWVVNGFNSSNIGLIQTSDDGVNWTQALTYSAGYLSRALEPGYDGTYYFVDNTPLANGSTVSIYYTSDGVNFFESGTVSFTTVSNQQPITSLQYVEGVGYYAQGYPPRNYFSTSLTASTWTTAARSTGVLRIGSTSRQPKGATSGLFVSTQFTGGFRNDPIEYSYDGINFSIASFPLTTGPYDVDYSQEMGLFVYTNTHTQTYYTSEDGVIWTSRNHTFGNEYCSVRFCPGVRTTAYKEGADK